MVEIISCKKCNYCNIRNIIAKFESMVIISKSALRDFCITHPAAEKPISDWYETIKKKQWKNFNELRTTFNSVDSVGNNRYVFNIKGNDFRLIALILFKTRTVFILFIGTHSEYDKVNASTIEFKK